MKKTNIKDSLSKLESITKWFEDQKEVDVEEGLKKVKEAAVLMKELKANLKEIENEFEEVKRELDE